jgi:L-fuculose-phosphate aldolase
MSYGQSTQPRRVSEHELRQEMVRVGRLMWERGYIAATDGNLSARLGRDRILVTPSGMSKGFLSVDDMVLLRPDGATVASYRGQGQRASSEMAMHLEVYRQRSDVNAVVHAHPPLATAFSIAGVSLARCVIPEVIVTLGGIPTTEYATPGTGEVPETIRQAIRDYDALVMAHHGSLTVGGTLWEAYLRLEKVEHTAEITLAAHQLGRVQTLSSEAVAALAEKRRELLQREGRDLCEGCSICLLGDNYQLPVNNLGQDELVQQISQAVMENLEGERLTQ